MISGAPASGKGTQCQMIVQKVIIASVFLCACSSRSITPLSSILLGMVKERLFCDDAKEKGWLLDGYPRSLAQAQSLEELGIRPDIYIVLEVPDEILIDRCVGRRLDPVTGKIYHLKNFPPETEEIKARLVTRPDDTEEKVKSRLEIYKRNAEAVSTVYKDIMRKIDGNRPKEVVFEEISSLLSQVLDEKAKDSNSGSDTLVDFPVAGNAITKSSSAKLKPSNQDVYRIGTLLELVRVIALSFADDGKRVKLADFLHPPSRYFNYKKRIEQIKRLALFSLQALRAMTDAAGSRPVILVNPRLKTIGRDKRLEYAASFENCYFFRLLYYAGTQYPIMGALRMSYPFPYELYKRVDEAPGKEKYVVLSTFEKKPTPDEINNAFLGKPM
ncbi:hypothetical protein Cgig2_024562 [Carnegiea gigantea]|uniref:adenylate kinase n=1 Tax=Carnegiea gigantea TaxID=171969 RepID=A0A9Q1JHE4_9CARY|nr:hypothetical protein Cgig2_024562 [Carnegiea gigantea]